MSTRIISVLGMHRSGTSCLTGTLEEAGVYLGPVSRKNPHNLRGNHERLDIMDLHNDVLASCSGAWNDPPEVVVWSNEQRQTLQTILSSYQGHALSGFKDPRTLLVLDGWLDAVPELEIAGIFRHPLMVAQSLHKRGKITLEQGLDLWQTYNDKLLALHRQHNFPMIEFVPAPGALRRSLVRLLDALELSVTAEQLEFYTPELQHQTEVSTELAIPDDLEQLYRTLQARSL